MKHVPTKLVSQGQVSVPATVRRALGLTPGSMPERVEARGRIVVQHATRHDSQAMQKALFPEGADMVDSKPLETLKDGIRRHMQRRHARG